MDTLTFIKEMVSKPALRVFLSYTEMDSQWVGTVGDFWTCLEMQIKPEHREYTEDEKLKTIKSLQVCFRKFGTSWREIFGHASRKGSQWSSHRELRWLKRKIDWFIDKLVSSNYLEHKEEEGDLEHKVDTDAVINSLHDIKSIEDLLIDNANSSNCFTNDEKCRALLLITTFPALRELKDPYEMLRFLLELTTELDNLPELICKACERQPQALLLIGSLLSFKPRTYDAWNKVKDDLVKIKVSNNGASDNHMWHIYTYCYNDLPYILTPCFLYLACYPMNYEIPARSLIEIWIAEQFVEPQKEETIEETANKYLEQLVRRSLVWVSERSISDTIKCCRVRQSIHEFCVKKSCEEEFLVANPNKQEMESVTRVAFYNDDKKQYTKETFEKLRYLHFSSVVCFDFDMNVVGKNILQKPKFLDVLELRKSTIPQEFLPNIHHRYHLKYLGLRGSSISELPQNIGNMRRLKTLDVRDTKIKTLPESLWKIETLRHVYVNPDPQIKGPPPQQI